MCLCLSFFAIAVYHWLIFLIIWGKLCLYVHILFLQIFSFVFLLLYLASITYNLIEMLHYAYLISFLLGVSSTIFHFLSSARDPIMRTWNHFPLPYAEKIGKVSLRRFVGYLKHEMQDICIIKLWLNITTYWPPTGWRGINNFGRLLVETNTMQCVQFCHQMITNLKCLLVIDENLSHEIAFLWQ